MTKRRRAKDKAKGTQGQGSDVAAVVDDRSVAPPAPARRQKACVDCGERFSELVDGRCVECLATYQERGAVERERILRRSRGRLDD